MPPTEQKPEPIELPESFHEWSKSCSEVGEARANYMDTLFKIFKKRAK